MFSEQECQELIDKKEQHVYESALVNFSGDGYVVDKTARDSDRVMLDDPTTAAVIFDRVRPWLPKQIGACSVCGVNERLRFLRYDVAQQFAPHYDSCYERPDGRELSFLTLQVSSSPCSLCAIVCLRTAAATLESVTACKVPYACNTYHLSAWS